MILLAIVAAVAIIAIYIKRQSVAAAAGSATAGSSEHGATKSPAPQGTSDAAPRTGSSTGRPRRARKEE